MCASSMGLLENLRPKYAAILRRIDIEGESIGEAALNLGLSTNNAKVRIIARETRSGGVDSIRACQACDDDAAAVAT